MGEDIYMPGATTVGLVCKEGAILCSERRYAYGTFVMSKVAKKVFKITDNIGIGAEVAMGVLESEYSEGLSIDEARPLILRAIRSALARDISSGDGVDLLVITEGGIKEESHSLVKTKSD